MASSFPINETTSFEALSTACGMNEIDLRRMVRQAMTNHIFQEREGRVAHTAASRVLAENDRFNDIIGLMCEEMFPGAAKTIVASIISASVKLLAINIKDAGPTFAPLLTLNPVAVNVQLFDTCTPEVSVATAQP